MGTSSVAARRHRVLWSGTAKSSPSRPTTEPISPSVWRKARRNTALSVSAVKIAKGEYQGCPPGVVRGSARQPSTASPVNQTVRLPRWRKLASYSPQLQSSAPSEFMTLCLCFGMWWRRSWFSLNGKIGIRGQVRTKPPTSAQSRTPMGGSVQQGRTRHSSNRIRPSQAGRFRASCVAQKGQILNHTPPERKIVAYHIRKSEFIFDIKRYYL